MSAQYEAAVAGWFQSQMEVAAKPLDVVSRHYRMQYKLKYGVNPHQAPASIYRLANSGHFPFEVVHGNPGYINLMDAVNAWQLVAELKLALDLPAAASFKHVSPAGAAVAVPLSDAEKLAYDVGDAEITPLALVRFAKHTSAAFFLNVCVVCSYLHLSISGCYHL
jgi:phosphoribosylaminoimidazolecarboxamide formyltransferase/IMP cyclohydrolase